MELYDAAGRGDTAKVKDLLRKGADANSRHGYYKGVALHYASKNGHAETVRELLSHTKDIDVQDIYGNTPLHDATEMGHIEVVRILVENRCRTDLLNMYGDAPIHIACADNNSSLTKLLLKLGNPTDIKNKAGNTPLHIVCENNNHDLVKILLENGCRTDIKNNDGETAFEVIRTEQERQASEKLKQDIDARKGIPQEVKCMSQMAVDLFIDAVNNKRQKIFHIRIMVVGKYGVGKSTFTIGLLNDDSIPCVTGSTNGISIYVGRCRIDRSNGVWLVEKIVEKRDSFHHDKVITILRKISSADIEDKYKDKRCAETLPRSISENETTEQEQLSPPKFYQEDNMDDETLKSKKILEEIVDFNTSPTKFAESDEVDSPYLYPKQMLEEAVEYHETCEVDLKEYVEVEMWDFGGQEIFYTSHQTFLSGRCVYTLLVDLSTISENYEKEKNMYLDFWINTIIIYAKGKSTGFPKIILVGIHFDQIPQCEQKKKINSIFARIEKDFNGHPAESHLIIDPEFCLNALDKNDPVYEKLRKTIFEVSETYPTWGEERPAYWILLEKSLLDLRQNHQRKIISVEEVKEINKKSPMRKLTETEIPVFLDFYHSLGNWLYFKEESLNKFVILDPKWLIDALSSIITERQFCENDSLKLQIWTELAENGAVQRHLIHELWTRQENIEFGNHEEHLLRTMEKFDLLVKPKLYQDDGEDESSDCYFIPCMLTTEVPPGMLNHMRQSEGIKLIFEFEGKFLPQAIFFRLIGSCIKMWPVLEFQGQKVLYSKFVGFEIDENQNMFLEKLNHKILMKLECSKPGYTVSSFLCKGIRNVLEETLNRLVETYDCYDKSKGDKRIFITKVPCCFKHLDCLTDIDTFTREGKLLCEHHVIADIRHKLFPSSETQKDTELKTLKVKQECIPTECTGLDKTQYPSDIREIDLARLARRLHVEPANLAAHLEMYDELRHLDDDRYYGTCERLFHLLLKWKNKKRANLGMLQNEIKEFGETFSRNFEHLLCIVMNIDGIYREGPYYEFLTRDQLRQLSTRLLNEIADRLLLKEGYQLCLELGITAGDLDRIRCNYPRQSAMHIREGLQIWKSKLCQDYQNALFILSVALDEVGIGNGPLLDVLEGGNSTFSCETTPGVMSPPHSPALASITHIDESEISLRITGSSKRDELLSLEVEKARLEIEKLKEEIKLIQLQQTYYERKIGLLK